MFLNYFSAKSGREKITSRPEEFVRSWIGKGWRYVDATASRSRLTEKGRIEGTPGVEAVWERCVQFK
jgi:hypothetical protein